MVYFLRSRIQHYSSLSKLTSFLHFLFYTMKKIFLLCLLAIVVLNAKSQTIYTVPAGNVSNTGTGTTGGLAWAINQVNVSSTNDEIVLAANANYNLLLSALPSINKINGSLIIRGNNSNLQRTATFSFRIIDVLNGTVMIENLNITNGEVTNSEGAGIKNLGALTLQNCTIQNCRAVGNDGRGAGIFNDGTLHLQNTTIKNNLITSGTDGYGVGIYNNTGKTLTANQITVDNNSFNFMTGDTYGGGIFNAGTATMNEAIISNNSINISSNFALGGGVFNSGNFTIAKTAIHNNTLGTANTVLNGAGVCHIGVNFKMDYCTISTNSIFTGVGSGEGAGIYCNNGNFEFNNISVVANDNGLTGTSGLFVAVAGGTIRNSLFLANNSNDITYDTGTPTVSSKNLATASAPLSISDFSYPFNASTIIYSTLTGNGGFAPTHALKGTATEAIEQGVNITGLTTDQRGMSIKNIPDIGAYEFGTFWVTTDTDEDIDNGTYSLREALNDANGGTGLPDTTATGVPYREIKFRIPSTSPLCTLFNVLPTIDKAMIIDGSTQLDYPSSTKVVLSGTGGFVGFRIMPSAARTKVYGLVFRGFSTSITLNANNVVIGDYVSSPSVIDRRNVFQFCGAGLTVNGNFAKINANYFGLQENGLDASSANNTNYDIQIGGITSIVIGTVIGESGKGNILAAKNGGIMFSAGSALISSTTIDDNKIGTDASLVAAIDGGATVGIHTNSNVNILTIKDNLIVNRGSVGGIGIFLNDDSKNVTIDNNQIGFSYFGAAPVPLPTYNGIQIRGGSLLPPTLGLSNNIVISNNRIGSNTGDGINIESGLFINNASNSTIIIRNNLIGIDNTGNAVGNAVGNAAMGISASGQATANGYLTVDNNIIANNGSTGLFVGGVAVSITITNNKIGVRSDGVIPAGNKNNGIVLTSFNTIPLTQAVVTGNIIANTSPAPPNTISYGMLLGNVREATNTITGNLIKSNGTQGINITGGCTNLAIGKLLGTANTIIGHENGIQNFATGVTIQNNYIGTNSSSATGLGNTANGIVMVAAGGIIQNNVVSGNGDAISLQTGADNISIDNNLIGLTVDGQGVVPNSGVGITVANGITGTIIKNNTISGNNDGVVTFSPILSFDNNKIGTNSVGNAFSPSIAGNAINAKGINLQTGSAGSILTNNIIASCGNEGIVVDDNNITIRSNKIGISNTNQALPTATGIDIRAGKTNINIGGVNATDGNVIAANSTGINLANNLTIPTNITIQNNLIGTDITGNNAVVAVNVVRNGVGLNIGTNHTGLKVLNNTISGNTIGMLLGTPFTNPLDFAGNIFGLNKGGSAKLGNLPTTVYANSTVGLRVLSSAEGTIIDNMVFSDNHTAIEWSAFGNNGVINNCKIGLDISGGTAFANHRSIVVNGATGTMTNPLNITNNGIVSSFIGVDTQQTVIMAGNNMGTDADGNTPLQGVSNQQINLQSNLISSSAGSSIDGNVIVGASNTNPSTIVGEPITGTAVGVAVAVNDVSIINNRIGITRNNSASPNDIGIQVTGTINNCFIGNNSADGNVISNNKNAAIYINSSPTPASASSVSINGNYIGTNISGLILSTVPTQIGIAAENNTNVGIDNNVINHTEKIGISLLSSPSPINQIQNTIIGNLNPSTGFNTIAGISVGSTWTMNFNTIENGDGVGVLLNGDFNTLSFNTIRNNKKQGVNIKNGSNNRINQCSIYNNGTAPNFAEKGIDLNLTTAQQGNAGQAAPVLQSVVVTGSTVTATVVVNIPVAGDYFLQFFKTTPLTANNDANQAEGEIYIGSSVTQNFTTTGTQTITATFTLLPTVTVANTDFVTATITSSISFPNTISNSSEFSNALTPCPNKILSITSANTNINCTGTTADVLIQYEDLQNPPVVGDLFDVDIDGNGTFDFTNIPLEAGNIIRLVAMSGGTILSNTKAKPSLGSCVTPAFANGVTVPASRIPSPIITNVQAIQPTSCNPNNGQLIVTLGNGTAGETYEVSTVGTTLGAGNFQSIVLSPNRTLTITGFKGGDRITPTVVVYRRSLACTSNAFQFNFNYIAPISNIDSTLNIVADVDEISPNFPTNIVVERTQDSIAYTLVNIRTGRQIGLEQIGRANTSVTFVTDTLFTNTDFAVYARSIRTGCSIKLAKTVTVKVISGILAEELDVLRAVYTSTIGDNWLIKWDFSKDISTFYGVRVFGGRVYDIKLGGNNLAGTLTARVNTLKRLAILEINNNQLDFGSVEPFVGQKYSFRYNTQARINRSIDTAVYENTNLRLGVITAGNFNRYQWQKDGVNVGSISSSPTLALSPLKTTDAGTYTCFVTNTIGTALTLERRTIRLKVLKYPSTLDSLLLVRLNDALGGNNWKNKWDRTKPVSQWYGIEMDGDKVISLNLANNNLVGTIPDIIPTANSILSDLVYLNLSGNIIGGNLPKTLGNLTKLQYLDVSKNNLQGEVIAELGNLRALKTLLLSFNNFNSIHPNISTLAALENLFVNNNQLKELPTALSGLRALQKFDASYNLLQQFPANFSTWTNLTYLALSNNQITALPNNWNSFANLQELYLQVNQLNDLPNTFTALRNLKTLYLHSNALDFADLEPLAVLPVLNTEGAVYEPQAKVGTAQEIVVALDHVISLAQTVNGTANTYEWWKDDRKIAGIAANQLNYLKYTVTFEDAGTYKLVIRNNIARRLALISQDIVVKVACGTSSSVQVGIAGNLQYCEGETYNTTLTAQVNAIQPIAYQWFRNNTRLAGEETATLKPVLEGSYTAQVRGEDGCMYVSKAITFTTSPKPVATLRNVGDSLIVNILVKRGNEKIVWYRNGEQIPNANGRTYKATTAGKYYAVVADTTICQARTPELNITITSIEEDLAKNLQLYPNPANDKVVLQTTLAVERLVLQNNLGQTLPIMWVKDADKYSIDLKNLPTGVYYLSIYHSKGKIQQKLHKE